MIEKPIESWRLRAAVSEALDVFGSNYVQEVWTKALARREGDPEGAVTSARTLLESVCKHILDDAEKPYREGMPLPQLYKLTAEVLELAPNVHTGPIFTSLFQACAEVVESIGRLRNHLSDSHGRGAFGTMPDWRHAELAVNLSAAMAMYLSAVWTGRQPTVADAIRSFIARREEAGEPIGISHGYTLETVARAPIGNVIAAKLQTSDVLAHWNSRRAKGIAPVTAMHDITYLRGALGTTGEDAIYKAIQFLRTKNHVQKFVPRERRVSQDEFDALIRGLREPPKKKAYNVIAMMPELTEFAAWSGRTLDEICSLRWIDVDFEKRTCKLPDGTGTFPILNRAWELVESLKPVEIVDPEARIFPYNSKSIGMKFVKTKNVLRKRLGKGWAPDLVFNDLRYEAACRLLEKDHPPHHVAKATGLSVEKVSQIFERMHSPKSPNEVSATEIEAQRRRRRRTIRRRRVDS